GVVRWNGDEERQRLLPPTMVAGHSSSDLGLAPEPGRGASCRRRYLALLLFSWFAFSQGLARSISLAMEDDLVDKNTNRLLLSSWSAVGFLAFPVLMYLMDKHGLRTSLIAALFSLLLGSGLRCITSAPPGAQTWLVHSSQLLIAIAGPSAIAAAPFISSTWFPQDERSIATAIGALANYLGAASAFLMQSFLIDSGNGLATRGGLKLLSHRSMETIIFNRMQIMLYVEFGMIAVLFVLVVLLMPRHPLLYPSTSAATRRLHYTEAIPRLLRWDLLVPWTLCSDNFTGRLKVIVLTLLSGATLSVTIYGSNNNIVLPTGLKCFHDLLTYRHSFIDHYATSLLIFILLFCAYYYHRS
uniref:Solute carrier family 49 member 4 n=1 Tax=Eptatretus burgeri TaxID=7764 RepID=A0A8C4QF85_EPTBU